MMGTQEHGVLLIPRSGALNIAAETKITILNEGNDTQRVSGKKSLEVPIASDSHESLPRGGTNILLAADKMGLTNRNHYKYPQPSLHRASLELFVLQHLVRLDIMIRCPENGKHRVLSSKSGELYMVRNTQSINLNQLKFHQTGKQQNTRHGDYINLLLTFFCSLC